MDRLCIISTTMQQFRHYSTQPPLTLVSYRSSDSALLRLKWRLQIHSLDETFHCWWDSVWGLHCNDLFCGNNLSAHLQEVHQIHGVSDESRVYCRWNQCNLELNKESLVGHIEEKHLGVVHSCQCDTCGKSFSHKDTLSRHKMACSGP